MIRTRRSLFYLCSCLCIIGIGLFFAPSETLKILQSNGDYGDVFPRVAGMQMSGLGFSIFGVIRARVSELYPATLVIHVILHSLYWRFLCDDPRAVHDG